MGNRKTLLVFCSLVTHCTAPTHADLRIFSALSTFPTRRARRAKSDQSSCSVRSSCLPKRRNPASVEMVLVLPSGSLATTGVVVAFPLEWRPRVFSYAVM